LIATIDYLILPGIALVAFLLKAMTGFGPAIIVISLGSLIIDPQTIVATSAVLDSIAGAILLRSDWVRGGHRYWAPVAAAIVVGSVVGAVSLKAIPADLFRRVLGIALLILGIWFIAGRTRGDGRGLTDVLPARSGFTDRLATFVGGVLGGLIGISGPPIIWHFGRRFSKRVFRQILVPVFLIAALARSATYASVGLMDADVVRCIGLALPGLVIGIAVGNRIFLRLSEVVFSRIVGSVLVAAALRILLQ
jgi:uncharacterized membrane protein YfcA